MNIIEATSPKFSASWAHLCSQCEWRHALYGTINLRFYKAYFSVEFTDRSIVVIGNTPLAGLRVTSHVDERGATNFSSFGQPSLYIEHRASGVQARRKAYVMIKSYVGEMLSKAGAWQWEHAEHLAGGAISPFGRHLLSLGGVPVVATTQMIDLGKETDTLFSDLSKSFRWSVNWGRKNLALRVIDGSNIQMADVEAFHALHVEAAGRETRSAATWQIQHEMVLGNEAFICAAYLDGRLVTAALFPYSPEHCYYGVSASRRELFEKPLSHVLLWQAICHARSLGCCWFEMGDIQYPYQAPPPLAEGAFHQHFQAWIRREYDGTPPYQRNRAVH